MCRFVPNSHQTCTTALVRVPPLTVPVPMTGVCRSETIRPKHSGCLERQFKLSELPIRYRRGDRPEGVDSVESVPQRPLKSLSDIVYRDSKALNLEKYHVQLS